MGRKARAPESKVEPLTEDEGLSAEEARDAYYGFTTRASDVMRQLGFAAIGVVWLFRVDLPARVRLPALLLQGALLAVGALSFDLLQYLYGSAAWGIFHGLMERRGQEHALAPRSINWVTLGCFWTKAALMIAAYGCILMYLGKVVSRTD